MTNSNALNLICDKSLIRCEWSTSQQDTYFARPGHSNAHGPLVIVNDSSVSKLLVLDYEQLTPTSCLIKNSMKRAKPGLSNFLIHPVNTQLCTKEAPLPEGRR